MSLKIVKVENYKFHDNLQKNGRKGLCSQRIIDTEKEEISAITQHINSKS